MAKGTTTGGIVALIVGIVVLLAALAGTEGDTRTAGTIIGAAIGVVGLAVAIKGTTSPG